MCVYVSAVTVTLPPSAVDIYVFLAEKESVAAKILPRVSPLTRSRRASCANSIPSRFLRLYLPTGNFLSPRPRDSPFFSIKTYRYRFIYTRGSGSFAPLARGALARLLFGKSAAGLGGPRGCSMFMTAPPRSGFRICCAGTYAPAWGDSQALGIV